MRNSPPGGSGPFGTEGEGLALVLGVVMAVLVIEDIFEV